MSMAEYDVDPEVLAWGDMDIPIVAYSVVAGKIYEDWMPDVFSMWDFKWWRWN